MFAARIAKLWPSMESRSSTGIGPGDPGLFLALPLTSQMISGKCFFCFSLEYSGFCSVKVHVIFAPIVNICIFSSTNEKDLFVNYLVLIAELLLDLLFKIINNFKLLIN